MGTRARTALVAGCTALLSLFAAPALAGEEQPQLPTLPLPAIQADAPLDGTTVQPAPAVPTPAAPDVQVPRSPGGAVSVPAPALAGDPPAAVDTADDGPDLSQLMIPAAPLTPAGASEPADSSMLLGGFALALLAALGGAGLYVTHRSKVTPASL